MFRVFRYCSCKAIYNITAVVLLSLPSTSVAYATILHVVTVVKREVLSSAKAVVQLRSSQSHPTRTPLVV